ncbi:MAG: AMP-binding protein [Planctomycetes bacterium]|nr:AMP-binding protein [Planctomycetota bacterium]
MPPGRTATAEQDAARALLALVRETVAELRPGADGPVGLDDRLEQVGVDSLARAQLLARVERRFGVHLPDEVALEAPTPRALLEAILASPRATLASPAGPTSTLASPALSEPAVGAVGAVGEVELPDLAATLIEVLEHHAARAPDRAHVLLHRDEGPPYEALTHRDLLLGARRVAAGLQRAGVVADEAVALMLPTGREYFLAFFGALLAGAVPVPLYPPAGTQGLEAHLRRQAGILKNARAAALITWPGALRMARLIRGAAPDLRLITTSAELTADAPPAPTGQARRRADDVALLQYTSGSTGDPKGVVLTHANLLANIRAMGRVTGAGPGDVIVSWLPLYHDMGLIGAWLGGLYHGCRVVVLSPLAFVARPARWLEAITAHRGTISAAPNFAYGLCAARLDDAAVARLDLSSWRLALNGAEPVSARTLEAFAARFGPRGLRREALSPVYGLAESAVGLCFPPPGRGPRVDRISRVTLLRDGEAVPAPPGSADAQEVVGCGRPLPGHEVRVVDDEGRPRGPREVGRVEFRGPSATRGYRDHPEATRALHRGGGWLDTGDLGYLAEGELFLTGRRKDLIIRAGRNVYPHEVEAAISDLAGVRKGCVAVFAAHDGGHDAAERLVVAAETRLPADDVARRSDLRRRIEALTLELTQTSPDDVLLLPPRSVPKTANGKVRRAEARARYEQGRLGAPGPSLAVQVTRLALSSAADRARRAGRSLGGWLFGAWAWLALVLLFPTAWLGAVLLPTVRARRRWVRAHARALLGLTATPLTVRGADALPAGPCVLVANHASYLDGVVLTAALPTRFTFAAKRELTERALVGLALSRLGVVFVERHDPRGGVEDTSRLAEALRAGESLVVFAEGTFDRAPGLLPFHMGAFVVAAGAGAPVVPAALVGTRALLPGETLRPRRAALELTLLPPLPAPGPDWADALALRDAARAAIREVCGEP